MARYVKAFHVNADANVLFNQINNYLVSEGYEYIQYEGENVFKKGTGMVSHPSYFKFDYYGSTIRFETWMKYALFPGVYVGEYGTTGFVGTLANNKRVWQKRIAYVEAIILQFGYEIAADNIQTNQSFQNAMQASPVQQQVYTQHNAQVAGQPPQGNLISKKDYINNYIPSFKRDLKTVAIACYICAGLNAIISLILYPFGILDSLVLLGVTLGMHLGKSKTCAIILLVFGCAEALFGFFVTGTITSIAWVVTGVCAVILFNKAGKDYKKYINSLDIY